LYGQELGRRATEAQSYLADVKKRLREEGVMARLVVSDGPVVDAIIEVAEREAVDLIAMASHGRTGLRRVFYGSVAAGVLHRVDRPLLLVRSEEGS
jgi:nucleotide-binding universal stress UspA family protein